jgi:hypothetical protein
MTIRKLLVASALALAFGASTAQPETVTPQGDIITIRLSAGELSMLHTVIDLNNAHAMETIGFFKRSASGPAEQVPFEIDGDYQPFLTLRSGADCAISGMRAFRQADKLEIVYALRKGGWTEKKLVTFVVFELATNEEGAPGTPPLYFRQRSKLVSKQAYCDVNRALEKEASLSATGAN